MIYQLFSDLLFGFVCLGFRVVAVFRPIDHIFNRLMFPSGLRSRVWSEVIIRKTLETYYIP